MKKNKVIRAVSMVIVLVLCILICSCEGVSKYSAMMLVRKTEDNFCSVSFKSLKGCVVLKPEYTLAAEGVVSCTAKVDEGQLDVYYDCCGVKTHLLTVTAGEEKTLTGGYIERGRVKVYVETEGAKGGKVEITLGTP